MEAPILVFLVNGGPASAMGIRARAFAARLDGGWQIRIGYRSAGRIRSIFSFLWLLVRQRPALCYVFDMGLSGVVAAGFYRALSRCRVVVDTGDAIYELSRSSGRGRVGLWLIKSVERAALLMSHRIVVRSHAHQEWLAVQGVTADVIPDGVDTAQFQSRPEHDLRRQHGLDGFIVIGVLGSLIWNPRWKMCYGWELVELIDQLRDWPVKGLIIGDGSGLPELKAQCATRRLADRIVFLGRIPYDELPRVLNLIDICLSTQTNDRAGQVRTTGKLPLYLACGRFILASEVGEAARVLPPQMLVPYFGTKDTEYPSRLAARVQSLLEHPQDLQREDISVTIAQMYFDYDILASRLRQLVSDLLSTVGGGGTGIDGVPEAKVKK